MKHPHAEVIKKWADGATIEAYTINEDRWYEVANPSWELSHYRVKPEKVYPETRMSRGQIKAAFHNGGWRSIANAALRHAIDEGQVVPLSEIAAYTDKRDMAIANAMKAEAIRLSNVYSTGLGRYLLDYLNVNATVAGVRSHE